MPAGCKRESKVFSPPPEGRHAAHHHPQHGRPLAPGPCLWIPAYAGMTVVCDAGTTPRPPQPLPSLLPVPSVPPAGPPLSLPPVPPLSFPQVVSGNPWSFLRPRRQTCGAPLTQHRRPLAPRPVPLDSRLRGNDSHVRRGDHPTTTPAPSVPPTGSLCPSRRSPSVPPAGPPSVIPAGCKRESMVFSPPPKADMRRTPNPTPPALGSPARASGFPLARE